MGISKLSVLAGAVLLAGPAAAQEECGRYPVPQASYSCTCPAPNPAGAVWGAGPYTSDSDLCTAALHAGVIGRDGGEVSARLEDGQAEYTGSTANGVTTQRWGRYDSSIAFDAPARQAQVTKPLIPVFNADASTASAGEEAACTGLDYSGPETVCFCAPGQGADGSVWGSGPYVAGSDLCGAARHAEAIGLDGGVISVIRVPGLTSYRGSERGGIRSQDWGEYNESFVVNTN
jgi:hypothetical protein